MADNASFKSDRTEFLSSEDDIVVREKKCIFFIPYSWNNDAIVLIHKKEKKNSSVHVIPIQVTITKPSKHSDSEQKFFNGAALIRDEVILRSDRQLEHQDNKQRHCPLRLHREQLRRSWFPCEFLCLE